MSAKQKLRRGLSFLEKAEVIVNILLTSEKIYNLKQIENSAAQRGVIPQSVKEVITYLLHEKQILCEKIGSSNIYWLFKDNFDTEIKRQMTACLNSKKFFMGYAKTGTSASTCLPSNIRNRKEFKNLAKYRKIKHKSDRYINAIEPLREIDCNLVGLQLDMYSKFLCSNSFLALRNKLLCMD